MKRIIGLGVLLLAVGQGGLALAQEGAQGQEGQLVERTIDFSDEIVEGELVRPEGELIEAQRGRGSASLISIREHFIDKMIQSAEDL